VGILLWLVLWYPGPGGVGKAASGVQGGFFLNAGKDTEPEKQPTFLWQEMKGSRKKRAKERKKAKVVSQSGV